MSLQPAFRRGLQPCPMAGLVTCTEGLPCASNPMETAHPMVNPGCQRSRLGPWMAWEPCGNPCNHVSRTNPPSTGTTYPLACRDGNQVVGNQGFSFVSFKHCLWMAWEPRRNLWHHGFKNQKPRDGNQVPRLSFWRRRPEPLRPPFSSP